MFLLLYTVARANALEESAAGLNLQLACFPQNNIKLLFSYSQFHTFTEIELIVCFRL